MMIFDKTIGRERNHSSAARDEPGDGTIATWGRPITPPTS
jgi:hypothetical protein